MRTVSALPAAAALLLALPLLGCRVDSNKDGDHKDVHIATPFGSMHVKTDNAQTSASTGLTPYPGALPLERDEDGDNSHAADVNLSFGSFQLGVHAVELQTADPETKVINFYRNDMHRYGAVIVCRGHRTVGEPARTEAGLTCDEDSHSNSGDELQLRAGSRLHQHIVGLQPKGSGTRIGLVALDLPPQAAEEHDSGNQE